MNQFFSRSLNIIKLLSLCLVGFAISMSLAFSDSSNSMTIASFEIPPYIVLGADKEPSGLFIDTVRDAAAQAGVKVTFNITNWPRAQASVKEGKSDAVFPVIWTKERSTWLQYHEQPVTHFDMAVFANKNAGLNFVGDLSVFKDKTIGKIAKAKMHPSFTELEKSGMIKVVTFPSIESMIKVVDINRVNAFVTPSLMGQAQIKKLNALNIVPFKTPVGRSEIYLALSKKSQKRDVWIKLLEAIHRLPTMEERYQN